MNSIVLDHHNTLQRIACSMDADLSQYDQLIDTIWIDLRTSYDKLLSTLTIDDTLNVDKFIQCDLPTLKVSTLHTVGTNTIDITSPMVHHPLVNVHFHLKLQRMFLAWKKYRCSRQRRHWTRRLRPYLPLSMRFVPFHRRKLFSQHGKHVMADKYYEWRLQIASLSIWYKFMSKPQLR